MRRRIIKGRQIAAFARHLQQQERSQNTIKQYICALLQFVSWLHSEMQENSPWLLRIGQSSGGSSRQAAAGTGQLRLGSSGGLLLWPAGAGGRVIVTRDLVLAYKEHLKGKYKPRSVNAKLAALNCFFAWQGWPELKVSALRLQQRMFTDKNQMLSKTEYVDLATEAAAQGNTRLALMMEMMCCTGMRVSELQYVTMEAVVSGSCKIDCKGKIREVFLPDALRDKLQDYIEKERREGRASDQVFATRSGQPVNARNVWREMKGLCEKTGIAPEKVYPHNLRHLFARTYYEQTKDIVRLADLLGHSSLQTTRIYTRTSGAEERDAINQLAQSIHESRAA